MIDNTLLFDECLSHREPLIDDFYCSDGLIISNSITDDPTALMRVNQALLDRLTAFEVAIADGDDNAAQRNVREIGLLLDKPNVNFTEFTSFFPTLDVSYSIYQRLREPEKSEFLTLVASKYIEKRHRIYKSHGYTATTLQVRKDFEKHKTGGNAANRKIRTLLHESGFTPLGTNESIIDTQGKRYVFIDASGQSQCVLQELKGRLGLRFDWQIAHQDKSADLIFRTSEGKILIAEFKHMKEGGGGQDKQVAELISLISHTEANNSLGYVAFLDGIYFNSFTTSTAPKTTNQVNQIRGHLNAHKNNFFVNTHGLRVIFND